MSTRGLIRTVVALLLIVDAVVWGYTIARVLNIPENHWGYDNRVLIPFFAAQLMASFAVMRRVQRPLLVAFVGVAAISVAASAWLVVGNVLLPYEVWLSRGMPPRPF